MKESRHIYKDSVQIKAASGIDLMLKSAFETEIEIIEARLETKKFWHPPPQSIIDYLRIRIKEISEMKNANL